MAHRHSFPHLLAPGRIGRLAVRNRICMAPMGSNLADADGYVGERLMRYYETRARGGAGLLIVGVGAVSYPAGACVPNQVGISDDRFLPGLRQLTERVHAHGAKIAIQLQHAGKVATQDMAAGRPVWVPSAVPLKGGDLLKDLSMEEIQAVTGYLAQPGARMEFHAMTTDEIRELVETFAAAAERAQRAGFDAVEIHGAHGYLIASFLSPAFNRRTDEYGGCLDNRARLLLEVLRAVKQRTDNDFPVWCRLDAKEFRIDGGITLEDAERVAVLAEEAGSDAIHVTAYADPTSGVAFTDAPLVHAPGGYVAFAEAIKRRVHVPVIAVGRIEPDEADALIAAGTADFVAMARKLLADPELPNKLGADRPEDVRPCIYCYRCVGNIFLNRPVACAVNPLTGREFEMDVLPASVRKHVLVVGGGPAGMEAARIAARRGHRVTLCEQSDRLGGTAWFAALVYDANARLLEYLESQMRALPVDIRLGCTVTPAFAQATRADVIVVATGARRMASAIPGADHAHVLSGDDLRSLITGSATQVAVEKLSLRQRAMLKMGSLLGISDRIALTRELTRHWMPLGKRVVVIGGDLVGIELAEFLSERGRLVTVIEESQTLAAAMALPRRWRVLDTVRSHGVTLLPGATTDAIAADGVVYRRRGVLHTAPADHVILATGVEADDTLRRALAGCAAEVHAIGDCTGVGYLEGALADATRVACSI